LAGRICCPIPIFIIRSKLFEFAQAGNRGAAPIHRVAPACRARKPEKAAGTLHPKKDACHQALCALPCRGELVGIAERRQAGGLYAR